MIYGLLTFIGTDCVVLARMPNNLQNSLIYGVSRSVDSQNSLSMNGNGPTGSGGLTGLTLFYLLR